MRARIAAAVATAALALPVGLVAATAPVATGANPGPNLVRNSTFERDAAFWKLTGTTAGELTRVKGGHSGIYAARVSTRVAATVVLNDDPNTVAATKAGATYTATAWVQTWAGRPVTLRLREVPTAGATLASAADSVTAADRSWHKLSLTYVARQAGSMLDLSVLGQGFAARQSFRADDVTLTETPAPTPTPTTTTTSPTPTTTSPTPTPTVPPVSGKLVPARGAWFGVAANPLAGESWDQALLNFEAKVGRKVAIAHYYHRGAQLFPTAIERQRANEGRLLLLNWRPENGNTWRAVANGASDTLVDNLAAHIKATFRDPFFLAIHGEPEDEVNPTAGSGNTAADYAAMYRRIILRLRAQGVDNVVSVLNLTGNPRWGAQPWFDQIYPGGDVVDWLAEDPYVIGPPGGWYDTDYAATVNRTFPGYNWPGFYTWATRVAPDKPIMIAEWGIDDPAGYPSWKPAHFDEFTRSMTTTHPRVKALVYWDQNDFDPVGITRVDSSTASLDAARRFVAHPHLNPTLP